MQSNRLKWVVEPVGRSPHLSFNFVPSRVRQIKNTNLDRPEAGSLKPVRGWRLPGFVAAHVRVRLHRWNCDLGRIAGLGTAYNIASRVKSFHRCSSTRGNCPAMAVQNKCKVDDEAQGRTARDTARLRACALVQWLTHT
jgi:hypothetical protein